MKRDLQKLNNSHFDVLVVGGGIYGAVVFWMATVAGKKTALIEQVDFGHATSANSQKIIHGGIRYLQTMDIARVWQSLRERNRLMWLAPHLVHPMICTMPLYGHGLKGREAFAAAAHLYNSIANLFYSRANHPVRLPGASLIGRVEFLGIFPEFEKRRWAGAAVWYEGMCQNTERLVLSFIKSADKLGGVAANYVKALKYKELPDNQVAVYVKDKISNQLFEVLTERVINCTGPWYEETIAKIEGESVSGKQNFAVGLNLVTKQILSDNAALGLSHASSGNSRLFFIVPWCEKSIIGTKWSYADTSIDRFAPQDAVCSDFLDQFNQACPEAKLSMQDVEQIHWGFVPCRRKARRSEMPSIATNFRISDASRRKNGRIITVLGVKYTTAGDVARRALRIVDPESIIDIEPGLRLVGGDINDFLGFKSEMIEKWKGRISESLIERLVINYGTELEIMLSEGGIRISNDPGGYGRVDLSDLLKAQALFAARREMAEKLSDVVFRRLELGSAGRPSRSTLQQIGRILTEELGWSGSRLEMEISGVKQAMAKLHSRQASI